MKMGQLSENSEVSLQDNDATDISDIFTEFSTSNDKIYPTESPQLIFVKNRSTTVLVSPRDEVASTGHPLCSKP